MRGGITQSPKNVATKVGQGIQQWDKLNMGIRQPVTYGGRVLSIHKPGLIKEGSKFDLVFKSPVLSVSGVYFCNDVTDTMDYGAAEVIVFGKT